MNSDFREPLQCFAKHRVRYLVVVGYSVIHYAEPRFTKDLDLWLEPSVVNARRAAVAFRELGIPLVEITEAELALPGTQFMLRRSPVMLDFLTTNPRLDFASCWVRRKKVRHDFGRVNYLHKEDLITAKRHTGRPQDLMDLDALT